MSASPGPEDGQRSEAPVAFSSAGLRICGLLGRPRRVAAPRLPAIVLLHGFGSNKDDGMVRVAAAKFGAMGYITLRFDMRGCGESDGERARVICLEQVEDTRNAVSFLAALPEVDADRIAVMGHSFGAAVAVYAAGVDPRIAACISSAGWGDGSTKLRQQHASDEAWVRFSAMVDDGRAQLARGASMRVSRFDIVPIPPAMRAGLPPGSFMEFPFEVVQSMLTFRPNDVVADISPRPLLLLHPSVDSVTPTQQSIDLFGRARMPTDLHLFSNIDHFIFTDDNQLAFNLVRDWLAFNLPLPAAQGAAIGDSSHA